MAKQKDPLVGKLAKPTLTTLGKLIPRLASNHNGDVIATVAAIRRTRSMRRLRNGIGAGMARTSLLVLPR